MNQEGTALAVWGAGSKGITFLNSFGKNSCIEAVVDINPYKQGKFVSGSGHKIISPQELAKTGVQKIVTMNPMYNNEIKKTILGLGMKAELEFA